MGLQAICPQNNLWIVPIKDVCQSSPLKMSANLKKKILLYSNFFNYKSAQPSLLEFLPQMAKVP